MSHKIVSIIPARGGSKSIPQKNIYEINNQPLISYTILDSLQCDLIEETFVSTDDKEIALISQKYGANVPFLRPPEYSTDISIDSQWAWHFLEWYENTYKTLPQLVVHLRPTTPIRDISIVNRAIEQMILNKEYTSLISIEELSESPYKWFKLEENKLLPLFDEDLHLLPKQMVPKVYKPNGYIDILKPEVVLGGSIHGSNILPFIVPSTIEIDSLQELKYAEYVLKIKNN